MLSVINPINKPTMTGRKEISVYEGEIFILRKLISAIKPIVYSNIIVPNDANNGIQKGLLTIPPPIQLLMQPVTLSQKRYKYLGYLTSYINDNKINQS